MVRSRADLTPALIYWLRGFELAALALGAPSLRPERGAVPLGDKALPCPGHLDARCSFEDSTCPPPSWKEPLTSPITVSNSIAARWEGRVQGGAAEPQSPICLS